MDLLIKQKIDKQDLSIFLRDLSSDVNINLKHMVEDMIRKKGDIENQDKQKKYNGNKKKKKPMKKKDIIIREQNEKRRKAYIEDDIRRVEYYLNNIDFENIFNPLSILNTNEGRSSYRLRLLHKLWNEDKGKYMKYIIVLFYELKVDEGVYQGVDKEMMMKVEKTLKSCDTKEFMMGKMGSMLKPLDYWNKHEKVFDEWQEKVINYISKNESVIVKAPTSAGKSFIAMATGVIHKKILYICPAKPVAYQVGSHFIHMGYKVHFLLDNISHYSYNQSTNIFIGTPTEVENNLLRIGNNFDYAVFDEIHNVNKEEDGNRYENLIKLLPCNFLALSATINNIEFLIDIMKKIKPEHKINYIEYNQRFINHQRWIWKDNTIKKIHPLCIFNSITDNFEKNKISFTPNDCVTLWEQVYDSFDEIDEDGLLLDGISPDEYFHNRGILSLNDCRDYEKMIKHKMIELSEKYPEEVQNVFNYFKGTPIGPEDNDIISFIRSAKKKEMFPMLMFHTDEKECHNLFNNIYEYLNTKELEEYPFHYKIMEKKDKLYQDYVDKREVFRDGIKLDKKQSNPQYAIKEKMDLFDEKQKNEYITNMINYYETKLTEIKNNKQLRKEVRDIQEKNLSKEMNQFIINPDFSAQDIYSKHQDFIFTTSNEPMSGDTIRQVRWEIKKTLGVKIPYESALFQMLKRGIGIYLESMPDEYNWQLQKLLSKKEIGIVISDRTLCLGIDLPVKTSCFLGINGNTFTDDEYLQMSGRAGRRGKDTQGNIVFFGDINYLQLMKMNEPNIIGNKKPIYENYKVALPSKYYTEGILQNMINPERKYIHMNHSMNIDKNYEKLFWSLRDYKNSYHFVSNLWNIEKELYTFPKNKREIHLFKEISRVIMDENYEDTINVYKQKKIGEVHVVPILKEYLNVLMNLHNTIRKDKYLIIIELSKDIFTTINLMLFNYII